MVQTTSTLSALAEHAAPVRSPAAASNVRPIRYGIIGVGMMGQEHIQNIGLLDGAEVTALCDPDTGMRAVAGALAPKARVCASLDEMLAVDDFDALVIVSPDHLHVGQLRAIAARRTLPILVEKPLYTDPADRAEIEQFARDYPGLVWVAMEYRYMPPIAAFLSQVHQVTGGIRMLSIREHRFPFLEKVGDWNRFNRNTGGTMVEKCCHFFDLMRLAIGTEPVRVMASAGQAVNHLSERYDDAVPDIWDHGYVIVDFDGGARAMLDLCMFAEGGRYQEEILAVGEEGKIEAFVPGPTRFWPEHLGAPPVAKVQVSPRMPRGPREIEIPVDADLLEVGDHNGATFYQHRLFLEAIREGRQPAVSLHDGAMAVRLGLAAQESALRGEAVRL
ncbi:MAG: Gfo/Idh/MocA family oxidoreductase [Devosiaceae bacterium]|nr:Gfo/Idh/MocA family oxidoreductase [Devosiaceae bacterium MH13]